MTEEELEKAIRLKTDITDLNSTLLEYQNYTVNKDDIFFIFRKTTGKGSADLTVRSEDVKSWLREKIKELQIKLDQLKEEFKNF